MKKVIKRPGRRAAKQTSLAGTGVAIPSERRGAHDMSDLPRAAATHKDFLSVRCERTRYRVQTGIVAEVVA